MNHVYDGYAITHEQRHALRECRDCGLFQGIPYLPDAAVARCPRCDAVLRRAHTNSLPLVLISIVITTLLFAFALRMPFLDLHVVGRFSSGTVFTGPDMLTKRGLWGVAAVVIITLVIAPAIKLMIILTVLIGVHSHHPPRWLPWVFGWLETVSPWSMVEVFLLGVLVAYTRLRALAQVDIGPALIALSGVMVVMAAADASLDHDAVWEALDEHYDPRPERNEPGMQLIGCHTCRLVNWSLEGQRCERCGHHLRRRKANSLARAWALVITATMVYIPANTYPIMTVTRLGQGGPHTIFSGVLELIEARLWPLAILVFVASIVVPISKLLALVVMFVMTHRRSANQLLLRTRLFRVVSIIGRWSMLDVFALTVLVALVRMGFFATVLPGPGAVAFCGVVVLTMIAAEFFDPRLMWDAAGADQHVVVPETKSHSEHEPA